MLEQATLGGGCFWCVEAALKQLAGVIEAVSGYAGGSQENPDYHAVCTGSTGHVEVVQFSFDAQRLDYRTLLLAFFTAHDPTTPDRQGNDIGTQYRSVIFTHSTEQDRIARELILDLDAQAIWPNRIVTQILPVPRFWPAESYHQDYFRNNSMQSYCAYVVSPKVSKIRKAFKDRLNET